MKNVHEQGPKAELSKDGERYLAFDLSQEQYAIPLFKVKEVIGMIDMTPIPGAPSHFRGVINLRGQVISVIDLRAKLKLAPEKPTPETSIIILDVADFSMGVIVDSVNSVFPLAPADISPASEVNLLSKAAFLSGIAKRDHRLTLLLEIDAILNLQEIKTLQSHKAA